jgi:hypothetical protein
MVSNKALGCLGSLITPGGKLVDPNEAMSIHRSGYVARLIEALGEMYKAVWFMLGDEEFFETCEEYIEANPSTTYNLTLYGVGFPDFLKQTRAAEEFPFLPELADFECTFNQTFHAMYVKALEPQTIHLRIQENPSLKMNFTPSMKLKTYNHSIYEIWKSCKAEQVAEDMSTKKECLCLYKNQEKVFVQDLSRLEYLVLERLRMGATLGNVFDDEEFESIDAATVSRFFFWLSSSGIVVDML